MPLSVSWIWLESLASDSWVLYGRRAKATTEDAHRHQQHCERQERRAGQQRVDGHHEDQRQEQKEHQICQREDAKTGKRPDETDVVRGAAHQIAGVSPQVEAHGKALELLIHRVQKIEFQKAAGVQNEQARDDTRAEKCRRDHHDGEDQRSPRLTTLQSIHDATDQLRDGQLQPVRQDQGRHPDQVAAAVFPQVSPIGGDGSEHVQPAAHETDMRRSHGGSRFFGRTP